MASSVGTILAAINAVYFEKWCAVAGLLFLGMALIPCFISRSPITTAMIYLAAGLALGPLGFGLIRLDPLEQAALLERLVEIALLISLFAAGLKLRLPFNDPKWWIPLRLAFVSMAITVGLLTLVGVNLLGLPLGAAVLLGAILAPTDPVLASDVAVNHPRDDDPLRFSLTGEASLNDGTAFPFVMLGLGLLGLHDLGANAWKWISIDILWATLGGLGIGALLGAATGKLVLYLRREKREAVGTDDFVALGLVAGTYGVAVLCNTYGFLAVFAAGLALRHIERFSTEKANESEFQPEPETVEVPTDEEKVEELYEKLATDEKHASSFMTRQLLRFNEALERVAELGIVVLLGGLLMGITWTNSALWLAPLLFFVIRPVSTYLGLIGAKDAQCAPPLIAWFGIRGLGSLYYLFYAIEHGLPEELANKMIAIVFSVVAISIVVHGISVTPLMNLYERKTESN